MIKWFVRYRGLALILLGAGIFGLRRFRPFVIQDIPLGYDPGLYKVMIEQYIALLPHRQFEQLAPWVQSMYPPFLGMFTSVLSFIGVSSDFLLTRGIAILSLFVGFALYFFLKQITRNKTIAMFGLILYLTSFVQRYGFWRGYYKQLLAMFLLLLILGLFVKKRWWMSIPLIVSLALTHRAGILYLLLVVILYVLSHISIGTFRWLLKKKVKNIKLKAENQKHKAYHWKDIGRIILALCLSGILALVVYRPLLDIQFGSLFSVVLQTSIDLPQWGDGFQAGGTFLTTIELLRINWWVLVGSLLGIILFFKIPGGRFDVLQSHPSTGSGGHPLNMTSSEGHPLNMTGLGGQSQSSERPDRSSIILLIAWIVGTVWVFGQGFFFQRMIAYADLFWLAGMAIVLGVLWGRRWRARVIVVIFLLLHSWTYIYRSGRLRRPVIEHAEFAFVQQIDSMVTEDAVIIVPGPDYSPWIAGWGGREVIAPGLFDINQRGTVEQGWTNHRWKADTAEKCAALDTYYAQLGRPLYLREGSKTVYIDDALLRSNIELGHCFQLIAQGRDPDWSFWFVDVEK